MGIRCEYEFAPGLMCELEKGHEEPYYPYLDYGQWGYHSDILTQGSKHVVSASASGVPPRDEWTGKERKE